MDAMAARGGERRRMYDEAMRAQGGENTDGDTDMGNPIPRPEPIGHGAGGEMRTEPSGHVADTMGDGDGMDVGIGIAGGIIGDENPASWLVPEWHSARSDDMRTEPSGHVACHRLAAQTQPCMHADEEDDVFGHGGGLDNYADEPGAAARTEDQAEGCRRHETAASSEEATAGEGGRESGNGGDARPQSTEPRLRGQEDDRTPTGTCHPPSCIRRRQNDRGEESVQSCGELHASQAERSRAAASRIEAVRARVVARGTHAVVPAAGGDRAHAQVQVSEGIHLSAMDGDHAGDEGGSRVYAGISSQPVEGYRERVKSPLRSGLTSSKELRGVVAH